LWSQAPKRWAPKARDLWHFLKVSFYGKSGPGCTCGIKCQQFFIRQTNKEVSLFYHDLQTLRSLSVLNKNFYQFSHEMGRIRYSFICQGVPRPGDSELPFLSSSHAATCYYQSKRSKIEAIPLSALLKDTTSEFTDLQYLHTNPLKC